MYRKSKEERSKWWANLTPEEQQEWLDKHLAEKEKTRFKNREKLAVVGKITNCMNCFHKKTKSCDGLKNLGKVCTSWFNPMSPVIGVAFLLQEIEHAEGRKRIAKKHKKKG